MRHLCLIFILCPAIGFANTALSTLQNYLNAFQSLEANFTQTVKTQDRNQTIRGHMVIAKPSRFIWKTAKPNQQWFISNGQKIWQYDIPLQQVTVKKLNQSFDGTPLMLLSGNVKNLGRVFKVLEISKNNFSLSPKKNNSMIKKIKLSFKSNKIKNLELVNNLNQKIELTFEDVRLNPSIKSYNFNFTPPKGVDILEG